MSRSGEIRWRTVRRWWQQTGPRRESRFMWRLRSESLEDRHLLAVITVDTLIDEADGNIAGGDISSRDAIALAAAGDTIKRRNMETCNWWKVMRFRNDKLDPSPFTVPPRLRCPDNS